MSSLRRGHANLLCIVPILTDDPRRESKGICQLLQHVKKIKSRYLHVGKLLLKLQFTYFAHIEIFLPLYRLYLLSTKNITAFTSLRTNLSPFTKGCRERDASMWLHQFLRRSLSANSEDVIWAGALWICMRSGPFSSKAKPSLRVHLTDLIRLNGEHTHPCAYSRVLFPLRIAFCLMLPRRVSRTWRGAMPRQLASWLTASWQTELPKKNWCDKQVSGWRHISCHTDKNRYYTWS